MLAKKYIVSANKAACQCKGGYATCRTSPLPIKRACHAFSGEHSISHDVVLSSGFLAFAQHSGFLQAVEEAGISVGGVMGTSAGALTGSLYSAGYTPRQVAAALSEKQPIQFLRPSIEPWKGGILSLEGVVERLRELLPPTFEGLEKDFAVGVVTADGTHMLIDQGPLPEAVAASAAIPLVFSSMDVPGVNYGLKDGGVVDRIGLAAWRQRRRQQHQLGRRSAHIPPCLVHVIERSSPFSGCDDTEAAGESAIHVVRCPKSGVNFFDLGDFERQFGEAKQRASSRLEEYTATLAKLPQVAQHQQQHHQQQGVTNNVLPSKGVPGVVLAGSLGAGNSSSSGSSSSVHSVGGAGLAVAAAATVGGPSSSSGATASPAGLAGPRPTPTAPRSTVRRAVQEDTSC